VPGGDLLEGARNTGEADQVAVGVRLLGMPTIGRKIINPDAGAVKASVIPYSTAWLAMRARTCSACSSSTARVTRSSGVSPDGSMARARSAIAATRVPSSRSASALKSVSLSSRSRMPTSVASSGWASKKTSINSSASSTTVVKASPRVANRRCPTTLPRDHGAGNWYP